MPKKIKGKLFNQRSLTPTTAEISPVQYHSVKRPLDQVFNDSGAISITGGLSLLSGSFRPSDWVSDPDGNGFALVEIAFYGQESTDAAAGTTTWTAEITSVDSGGGGTISRGAAEGNSQTDQPFLVKSEICFRWTDAGNADVNGFISYIGQGVLFNNQAGVNVGTVASLPMDELLAVTFEVASSDAGTTIEDFAADMFITFFDQFNNVLEP